MDLMIYKKAEIINPLFYFVRGYLDNYKGLKWINISNIVKIDCD